MPTYEYKCEECSDRFDHFQSMSSDPLKVCSKCGGKLRRLIGEGAGIIFKGSGFYCTDYKKSGSAGHDSSPAAKASDSSPSPSTTAKDSTTASKKPGSAAT